jgi:Ca2+-binding RTX toxin-like protein
MRWLTDLLGDFPPNRTHRYGGKRQSRLRRLFLEPLEQRHLLTIGWGPTTGSAQVQLSEDPCAPCETISFDAYTVAAKEGAEVVLGLHGHGDWPSIGIEYYTADVSAQQDVDYQGGGPTWSQFSVIPGPGDDFIYISAVDDGLLESPESFAIYLRIAGYPETEFVLEADIFNNQPPVAGDDNYSLLEGTALSIGSPGLLTNDSDPDCDSLTALLETGPASGSLALDPEGSFTYTPTPNFNGTVSFTYRADDGSVSSNVATVMITVAPVNDAPVAAGESYSTPEGTALTINAPGILANDTDVEGSDLTAALVTGPASGSLTLNGNGSFTYVPATNFVGTDSFTYQANDGQSNSNIATVAINVLQARDIAITSFYSDGKNLKVAYSTSGQVATDWKVGIYTSTGTLLQSANTGPTGSPLTIYPTFDDIGIDYHLIAVVDSDDEIDETNESNNTAQFAAGTFVVQESLFNKAVHVHGTDADDVVALTLTPSGQLSVNLNNQSINEYVVSQIRSIHVRTHGGHDQVITDLADVLISLWLIGGDGNDILQGGGANDWISGGQGNDILWGGAGIDELIGSNGNDQLSGGSDNDFLFGGFDDDSLAGEGGNDVISGNEGSDLVSGGEGNDFITGGSGNDAASGDSGNDTLYGESGDDNLSGGDGNDVLSGGADNDTLAGDSGDDAIYGQDGIDSASGGDGDDLISGGEGNDTLDGDQGNDGIFGGNGDDDISGGDGNDSIDGGSGDDGLSGNAGDDDLFGGSGDDDINGGGQPGDQSDPEGDTGGEDRAWTFISYPDGRCNGVNTVVAYDDDVYVPWRSPSPTFGAVAPLFNDCPGLFPHLSIASITQPTNGTAVYEPDCQPTVHGRSEI